MKRLNKVLEQYFEENQLNVKIEQYKIFEQWEEIVGEKISQVAMPQYIKHRTLWIKVENSVWKTELNFMKDELMKKIAPASNNQIKKIIFI